MFKKLLAAAATLLLGAGLAVGTATPAFAYSPGNPPTGPAANHEDNWEWASGESCDKDDNSRTTPSYTVVAPAANRVYSKIILKSATVNSVFNDPAIGSVLTTSNNQNISHIIFCTVPQPPPADTVDCTAAVFYKGGPLSDDNYINMTIIQGGTSFGMDAQINAVQPANGDPASESGLYVLVQGPLPGLPAKYALSNADVASGTFTFAYSNYLTGEWTVDWVQFDGHNAHFEGELKCGTPLYDADASVSILPATCDSAAQLVLEDATNATWGDVTGAYSVTAEANDGHRFAAIAPNPNITVSGDGKTKTFTGTLAAQLTGGSCIPDPQCLPKSAVSYTYSKLTNAGTITVVNPNPALYSNDLCKGFWVTATSWKFLAGDSQWPQKLHYTDKLAKITSVGVYDYSAPVVCGQGDIYASFIAQPDPSQYLLGSNQPGTGPTTPGGTFVETFLHNMGFATSTPGDTWTVDAPGCNKVPVTPPTVEKIEKCGVYGSIVATDTALVDYTVTPLEGQTDPLKMQGSYLVTAVAISPAVLNSTYPVGGWPIELNDYYDCVKPVVTVEVGGCYPQDKTSYKNLTFVFDNSDSTIDVTFTVPSAIDSESATDPKPSITVIVPAGDTVKVKTNAVSTDGASYAVYANGDLLDTVTVDAFVGCLDSTPGDPKATPAGCVAGEQTLGNIWVDLVPGLDYTITGTNPGNTTVINVTTADNAVPAGTYEVSVVAQSGYILGGDTVWPYEITVDPPVNCVKPFAKAELGVVDATCVFDGSIDNSKVVLEHAAWDAALPTAPGTYTVTATAETGYTFDGTATTKSIPVTIVAAADVEDCQPTLDFVLPKVTWTQPTCTTAGSYTLGAADGYNPAYVKWTVNGVADVISGTYPVTTSQVVTIVAVPVAPHGLEPEWTNPAPITFTKPSAVDCGDLPTLAFTGGAISLGVQTLVGAILFVLIGGALLIRRRFQNGAAE